MNPYKQQPAKASWTKSISNLSPFDISGLYEKKFEISPQDRIVTAGSCFAQHIARHLAASGYRYCDYERAPHLFPSDKHSAYNYGVFSARYCNIYTVRQLLQTFHRAFGMRDAVERVWQQKDGFVDPFRPVVEPEPFRSVDECEASRFTHYRAVRRVLNDSDIFIFTLGLTEGWIDKRDGSVYPLCPGTVAGEFDDAKYEFHNFRHSEILDDFFEFVSFARSVNPSLKFLLTVSPVALKMTASKNHVLVANTHSKSTLRSVAAEAAASDALIDYFPSFEIISSHPMRATFFQPDMREVNPAGVKFVMGHFSQQHPPSKIETTTGATTNDEAHDVVCEEMLLEQAAQ